MVTELTTGAKYLLQLAQNASLDDFLKEAKIFFDNSDVKRDLFKHNNYSHPTKYELSEPYQNLAAEFGKTPLATKLNKLSADIIIAAYELPIFWGTVPMKLFREKLANLTGTGQQVMVPLIEKVVANPSRKEGWAEVFLSSLFAELEVYPKVEHESVIVKFVNTFETLLKGTTDKLFIYNYCEAYRKFFEAFAQVVVDATEPLENTDLFLTSVCVLTGYHPAFCKLVLYPNTDKISAYLIDEIQAAFVHRLHGDGFVTWPMFESAYASMSHVMISGKHAGSLRNVGEYVTTVGIVAKDMEEWNTKNRFHEDEYCSISAKSTYKHLRTAQNFKEEVLKGNWAGFVSRNPITGKNVREVVLLQKQYYRNEWSKQFEKITVNNVELSLGYVAQMDAAFHKKEWERESVLGYIAASNVWKEYSTATAIDLYYKYRSLALYESILQRSVYELPNDWLREKHLHQLLKKNLSK